MVKQWRELINNHPEFCDPTSRKTACKTFSVKFSDNISSNGGTFGVFKLALPSSNSKLPTLVHVQSKAPMSVKRPRNTCLHLKSPVRRTLIVYILCPFGNLGNGRPGHIHLWLFSCVKRTITAINKHVPVMLQRDQLKPDMRHIFSPLSSGICLRLIPACLSFNLAVRSLHVVAILLGRFNASSNEHFYSTLYSNKISALRKLIMPFFLQRRISLQNENEMMDICIKGSIEELKHNIFYQSPSITR